MDTGTGRRILFCRTLPAKAWDPIICFLKQVILASIIMTFYEKISTLAAAKEQKDMINKIDKLKILPYWRKRIL